MKKKKSSQRRLLISNHKYAYFMIIPVVLYYIIFCYMPMFGMIVAFKDYSPIKGIWESNWVGFKYFKQFFTNMYFPRIVKNTVMISLMDILINFPLPIILALLFNEVKNKYFKTVSTTIMYFPHFISIVVVCGMIRSFTMSDGIITNFLAMFGMKREPLLMNPALFKPIYVLSGTWQQVGWNSIIYMAAICGIDMNLYEACKIDGGGKWRQLLYITLPSIMPTIIILFIMRMGAVLSVGSEKVILLYNSATYESADVISSYVYRKGLQEQNWGYGTAVGLVNSVINVAFLVAANTISNKTTEMSLW